MDILIRDIEPFKEDRPVKALVIYGNGDIREVPWCSALIKIPKIELDAKAIELPPHGRLIEAYFDYAEFKKRYKDAFGDNFDLYNAFSIFNDMIVNAPTVLEASDGSDN